MLPRRNSLVQRYVLTLAIVALATAARFALEPVFGLQVPFVLYFPTVVVCAWFGGLWPGILSTVLGAIGAFYFFIPPQFTLRSSDPTAAAQLIIFTLCGVLTALLAESLHVARRKAEENEVKEREQRERFAVTLASVGDAVIATDAGGSVTYMNEVAQSLTGWDLQEAQGEPLERVFNIVNEHTRQRVENPALRAIREGRISGLANHSLLMPKGGGEIRIDDSSAPITGPDGNAIGAVLVFHDITERRRAEQTRALLAEIVSSSDDAVISKTLDGIITSWNAAAEKMFEYTAEEAVGQSITLIIPPERLDEEQTILAQLRKGERIEHFETVRVSKSGKPLNISLTVSPVRDSSGRIVGASKVARDITERIRAEHELRRQREWLSVTLSSIGDAVIATDTAGAVTFLNPVAESLTGWTHEQAAGWPLQQIFKIVNEQTRAEVENPALRAMREGMIIGLANHTVLIARDGTERPIDDSGAPIIDADGHTHGAVLIFRDVAERRRAAALLDLSSEAILAWEFDGPITYWSRGAEALYGFTREQAIGQVSHELLSTVHPKPFGDFIAQLAQQREITAELVHTASDGRTVRVESRQQLVMSRGRRLVLGTNRDITERARIEEERSRLLVSERAAREQAEAASRAKDEFVAMVSHELRAPLNSILGWAQLMRTTDFNPAETARALETIERNTKVQVRLIEDLMDTSRVITGKLVLSVRPVEIGKIVDAALDSIRAAAFAKSITVNVNLDPDDNWVSGDPGRLQQVVWNLLSNAVKFTPKQGRIDVRIERTDSHLRIIVSDSGVGINPEFLPHVFDRFRQESTTSKRKYGGLGLGLAIVKQLVELHGGTVKAYSPGEGLGATFTVTLPTGAIHQDIDPSSRAGKMPDDAASPTNATALAGLRIMVVDDDPDSRELLRRILIARGAEVRACASAAEVLEAVEHWRPSVLVSDVSMPDEDGYSLLAKLRKLGPDRGGSTPAVALTGYARSEDRTHALAAGFQMHVPKPVEADELVTVVASLAGRLGTFTKLGD